ncbi:MAG: MgtC/SapB family protein [Candidatus Bathyarchaeota archaeon]|nr:MAG: MgtC/SapB family protein [Candidatus Bathyarchaeota archaeon]
MIEITEFEVELVVRVILSFVLGGVVGLEREVSLKPAGLRTHILVGLGSTLLTILSLHAFPGAEPSRVAASVIVGIGFLGAGTILKSEDKVIGLTTAASLWVVSSVGVAIGAGFYVLAVIVAVMSFLVLKLDIFERTAG